MQREYNTQAKHCALNVFLFCAILHNTINVFLYQEEHYNNASFGKINGTIRTVKNVCVCVHRLRDL